MAFSIAKSAVEAQIKDAVAPASAGSTNSSSGINWSDYNFPPCLHLVHFSLSELQGSIKRFVLNLYLSFMIIFVVLLINGKFLHSLIHKSVLSTIIQASKYSPGIEVFYSFLSMRLFPILFHRLVHIRACCRIHILQGIHRCMQEAY